MADDDGTVKAAWKVGRRVVVRDTPRRALEADQIRLAVEACGICGTDLHEKDAAAPAETQFGHEVAGTIVEVGAAVRRVKVGDRIVLDSSTPCGQCDPCRNARQELCRDVQSFFLLSSFGFAREMVAPAICAVPRADLSPEVACLSEPLGVAIDMVRLADITVDGNVLIMGPGPIGLMALALVKRMGARRVFVSGTSRRPRRNELALRFGADAVIESDRTPLVEHAFGCDIDRVLVTTPPATLSEAFAVASNGGIISFIGIAHGEGAYCRFDVNDFHFKKLQLRASFASPALYTPLALGYLGEKVVDGEALISHRFPLGRIPEAMEVARNDPSAVKVVVTP